MPISGKWHSVEAIQWLHNFTGVKFVLGNSLYVFSA
jgi:hypothetical protein